jgi:hypothetical protein
MLARTSEDTDIPDQEQLNHIPKISFPGGSHPYLIPDLRTSHPIFMSIVSGAGTTSAGQASSANPCGRR